MIEFRQARKEYGETVALEGLDLRVESGETVCLIGTSGSGKTTALKMVNRLIEPTSGSIFVGDVDATKADLTELRRSIGYVIQRGGLFPHMTVAGNIGLLCKLEGWEKRRIRERARELLELVDLPPDEFADRMPSELSGGQQQRVSIARALAFDPDIMLMDEPFGALDPITRTELHKEFISLKDKLHKTTLLVTHDLAEAFKLGDRIALLHKGKLIQTGTEEDFLERPATEFVEHFVGSQLSEL
ncbi:MAG: ATP-binding cassette domain-containing protein [Aridibacter famidurans]|nr:ATP-binding cassette domain-containing protein [Aridibacter famidurans]